MIYAGLTDTFHWYGLRIEDERVDAILNRLHLPDQNAVAAYHDRVAQERERRRR